MNITPIYIQVEEIDGTEKRGEKERFMEASGGQFFQFICVLSCRAVS